MGSEIIHTPFSLSIPNILCQTFRMRNLTATICLTIAVLLGSAGVSWAQENPILDKQSATQMFALSSAEWVENVSQIKTAGLGRAFRNPNGSWTLIYRPDPQRGLLSVTPSYKPNQKEKPFKIDVGVIFDRPLDRRIYEQVSFEETKRLLAETAEFMRPEFSVMGYLLRNKKDPPSLIFTIFETGKFPPIDTLVNQGRVCPPRNGMQICIKEELVGAPRDDSGVLAACVSKLSNSPISIGRTKAQISDVCICLSRQGKSGRGLDEAVKKCITVP